MSSLPKSFYKKRQEAWEELERYTAQFKEKHPEMMNNYYPEKLLLLLEKHLETYSGNLWSCLLHGCESRKKENGQNYFQTVTKSQITVCHAFQLTLRI